MLAKRPSYDPSSDCRALINSGHLSIPSSQLELGPLLGQGAFGRTFRAAFRGQQVAVKQVRACSAACYDHGTRGQRVA